MKPLKRWFRRLPLRAKLALAALTVEAVMLLLLIANGARLGDEALAEQGDARIDALTAALAQTLVAPLAQQDDGAARELLDALAQSGAIAYAEVRDAAARPIHRVGGRDAGTLTRSQPVTLAGQYYGELTIGIAGDFVRVARAAYLRQSVGIALVALLVSGLLLFTVLRWLTRRVEALSLASRRLAAGELDAPLPPADSRDEIGQLIESFADMAQAVRVNLETARYNEALTARYLGETEQERARLAALLSAMNLGILFVANDGVIVYCNPAFLHIWRLAADADPVGQPVREALARAHTEVAEPEHFSRHLHCALEADEASENFEIRMADGRVVTELDYPVRDREGHLIGHLWVYEDITLERETAEQLAYLAERDPLTGLFNRHRFQNDLERALVDCDRHHRQCAVMFFDLDEFKAVNDTYGHRAGDMLLMRIAGEIGAMVRRNETFARLGGDEFAILIPDVGPNEAEALAERVVRAVAHTPFHHEGRSLHVSASLGISLSPGQAADADELVSHADIAMYQAKSAGRNTWRAFRPDSTTEGEMRNRVGGNAAIAAAIERGAFQLHYQGIYRGDSGALCHLEALLRMYDSHTPGLLVAPAGFIPAAEKSGRIGEIDRWVIREAVRALAAHPNGPAIAVNLSGRTVSEPGLPQFIAEALRDYAIAPTRLLFEITETTAVADLADAQRLIDALRVLGCRVCLDDFGVGFASFAYLKYLAVDFIKIDGLFIRTLADDPYDQIFVRAMVDVARGLGKTVVAECVEDARTLALLRTLGVDCAQGWYFDHPMAEHPALAGPRP